MQIHQILPMLNFGDAIGNDALEIRSILNTWGYKSEIYTLDVHPKLAHIAKDYKEYEKISSPDNVIIFHFSIGSDINRFVSSLPEKKILIYHNLTPPDFFSGVNESIVHLLRNGSEELKRFINLTELALGDSEFNQRELIELGFKNTGVLPIIIDFEKYNQKPDKIVLNKFDDEYTNFIFVGRLAPNKKQEDIIKIFYYFNKCIDSRSRLFLIGSYKWTEKYYDQLKKLVKRLDLENVHITGHVNFEELLAYYKLGDVFISMSEHEGFCVPLLESMHFGIPIIAYNSTAIPYTLNGSGVLVNEKRYEELAELAHILVKDEKVRNKIIEKQKQRLEHFKKSRIEAILKRYIEKVIS